MADLALKRNLVLAGHGGAGKTSLADTLLFKAKVTSRWGKVEDGTSFLDTDDDERERRSSIRAAFGFLQHDGKDITIIDTPGYPDFIGEVHSCMPVVESVVIVISAADGIGVNTRRCWEMAIERGKPRMIVITKLDNEHVSFEKALGHIREVFGARCIPMNVPVGAGGALSGVASVLDPTSAPGPVKDQVETLNMELVEAAVEADDAVMEKYLESGEVSTEELRRVLPKAFASGTLTPIFCTSVAKDVGHAELLDAIANFFPSPSDVPARVKAMKGDAEVTLAPEGSFAAQVFRIQSALVGKQAFLRVWSGSAESGGALHNVRVGKSQKVGEFQRPIGKESRAVKTVSAGDIFMLPKVDDLTFGDTLTTGEKIEIEPIRYPKPMVALAISPKSRNDETKLGESLHKLSDGDPTFEVVYDKDTKELVARGLSELHLQLMLRTLKDRYKVEVETRAPRIPYRETITAACESHHRHKKQTGGAGQFGEVYIKMEPLERGAGFEFVDDVVGGVIPNVFIPAVEKGIREKMVEGVIAGYPVVDFRVRLYDGKHHPVDSKEIAFKTAGREAFKKGVKSAKPKLLEPIVTLTVSIPAHYMGDITGDLNGRRGRVVGMDTQGDLQVIKAQVPLAEIQTYSATLRSITGGEGAYSIEFSHYDIVPAEVTEKIVALYQEKDEE